MPESHKHQQERPITNRSGQQYPGEIAAGGPEAPEGLPGKEYAKGRGVLAGGIKGILPVGGGFEEVFYSVEFWFIIGGELLWAN